MSKRFELTSHKAIVHDEASDDVADLTLDLEGPNLHSFPHPDYVGSTHQMPWRICAVGIGKDRITLSIQARPKGGF